MPSIITREERETPVLDLYNQGKNIREIAKGLYSELQIWIKLVGEEKID